MGLVIMLAYGALFWSLAFDRRYVGVLSTLAAIGGFGYMAATVWFARRG